MAKRNYAEEFKVVVEATGYELLSPYIKNKDKVSLRCGQGHEYLATPENFKKGGRCPDCSSNRPFQAKKRFEELLESEGYELLSPYKKAMEKVALKCNHGHEYKATPSDFTNGGKRCPVCSGNCPVEAKKRFEELLESEGYELLSPYKKVMDKVTLKCRQGHEYKVTPNSFTTGCRCPECAKNLSFKSLYILRDLNNPNIAKIGVSFNPWIRCKDVTKDSNGLHEFEVFFQEDMSFEIQKAGDVEAIILSDFHDSKVYPSAVFNGATEILHVTPEQLKQHVQRVGW